MEYFYRIQDRSIRKCIWKEKKITRKVLVSPSRQLNIFQINSATVFDLKSMEKSIYLVVKQEKKDEHNIFNSNSSIMKIMKMMVIYFKEREKKANKKMKIAIDHLVFDNSIKWMYQRIKHHCFGIEFKTCLKMFFFFVYMCVCKRFVTLT